MPKTPKNSKVGLALNLGGSALAIVRTVKQMRRAKGTQDKLTAANTVAGLLPLITSALIVLRRLRGRSAQPGH
ncbi:MULTISPECIES: hypothetical protein [Streptomyces]|uniref:DUF4235 domain-containing protein n=2 Tax=Streptomyces TaxID=1883 RepID=A0ABU2RFT2_9ACTN|nr:MULTISPECIES: hypothetical protein [unclassified Streptomyces]MBK3596097.1 hypothetical protein [Streptomyces sp. MBT51]MDT0427720.1 hypothetical protein [Streptomyces sp. DSM 41770]HBF85385.1 hypothetical protein [Streptomyces sp.]